MPPTSRPRRHVVLPLDVPGANVAFVSAARRGRRSDWRRTAALSGGVTVRSGRDARADVPGVDDDAVVLSPEGATGVHVVHAVRSRADLEEAGGVAALLGALDAWADRTPAASSVVAGRPATDPGAVLRLLGLGGPPAQRPAPTSAEGVELVRLMEESIGTFERSRADTAARGCADAGAYLDWVVQDGAGPAGAPDDRLELLEELRRRRVTLIGDDAALAPPGRSTGPGLLPPDVAAGAAIAVIQGAVELVAAPTPRRRPIGRASSRELASRLVRGRGPR